MKTAVAQFGDTLVPQLMTTGGRVPERETWSLTKGDSERLITFDRHVLRNTRGPSYTTQSCKRTRMEQIKNRKKPLYNRPNTASYTGSERLDWFGHVRAAGVVKGVSVNKTRRTTQRNGEVLRWRQWFPTGRQAEGGEEEEEGDPSDGIPNRRARPRVTPAAFARHVAIVLTSSFPRKTLYTCTSVPYCTVIDDTRFDPPPEACA